MRGTLVPKTWVWDPSVYAPSRYRRSCRYEAFIPDALAGDEFDLSSTVAGVVSDAEQAIMRLNASASPALAPLARLIVLGGFLWVKFTSDPLVLIVATAFMAAILITEFFFLRTRPSEGQPEHQHSG